MRIFLTGGTGSLGQAILKRAEARGWDDEFTVYSRDEVKQAQVKARFPSARYVLGDVRDERALAMAMRKHDIVIHAAANKQVPAAEVNPMEAVETNVLGSRNLVRVAVSLGIGRVVGISTDKSVGAYNCYGHTKALMEKMFSQGCLLGETQFVCVRYGNVLGSRGSIVPLFRKQMLNGGSITITDPTMTRFWLTLGQAVDLVEMGMREPECGVVIVPKAAASTMETLAFAVAPRCGIEIIGTRPGEKQHESLIHPGEAMHTEDMGEYFKVWPAYTEHRGNLPAGYEYTSEKARQLTTGELREMVQQSETEGGEQ